MLVRQSFFRGDRGNFVDLGGGVLGCRGLHSSFRTSQGGLSLNIGIILFLIFHSEMFGILTIFSFASLIDVSTTMIVKPGPVIDFLLENQNVKTPRQIDWTKVRLAVNSDCSCVFLVSSSAPKKEIVCVTSLLIL